MLSNKTITTLVFCIGLVTSIWLIQTKSENVTAVENTNDITVGTNDVNTQGEATTDWKKILVDIDGTDTKETSVLTNNNSESSDETTLTAQMSRDFFSQYLLAIKKGALTSAEANKIAENTLSLPEYTQNTGAKYIVTNLKITSKTDLDTVKIYKDTINQVLKDRSSQVKNDPMIVLATSLSGEKEKELLKLDPVIAIGKALLTDLLNIEVPIDAVKIHLDIVNANSNIVADLEAMKAVFLDPIKGFAGMGQYSKHLISLKTSLENLNSYFIQKLGSDS